MDIIKILPTKADDHRGPTWEWKLPDDIQVTVCVRKAGSSSCHYHRGVDSSKNPERLLIAAGKIKMTFLVHSYGQESQGKKGEVVLAAGDAISISPYVIHKTEILENAVIIEYRITHFDLKKPDTFPVEI